MSSDNGGDGGKYKIYLFCRKSATCTHVSALLHALVVLSPSESIPPVVADRREDDSGDDLPVTSYRCQWVQPRKRKQSSTKMSDASFKKHVYGRERKHSLQPIEDFDPRPPESIGTEKARLDDFLSKTQGLGLSISSLLDPKLQVWKEGCSSSPVSEGSPQLPSKQELVFRVESLKESLKMSPEAMRNIELKTKDQHQSLMWHFERRFRITSSSFGDIRRRLESTPPDSLVLRILGIKKFSTVATQWGKDHEQTALEAYVKHQNSLGHPGLYACKSGFVISETHPFLGIYVS